MAERGTEIRRETVPYLYRHMQVGALPSVLDVLRALADQRAKPGIRYAEKEQDQKREVLCQLARATASTWAKERGCLFELLSLAENRLVSILQLQVGWPPWWPTTESEKLLIRELARVLGGLREGDPTTVTEHVGTLIGENEFTICGDHKAGCGVWMMLTAAAAKPTCHGDASQLFKPHVRELLDRIARRGLHFDHRRKRSTRRGRRGD